MLILAAAYGNVANAELDYEAITARAADEVPPAPADAKTLRTLKAAGIEVGKDFDIAAARRRTAKGLQRSMGTFRIRQEALKKLKAENGWIVIPDNFAAYGTDYQDTRRHRPDWALRHLAPRRPLYPPRSSTATASPWTAPTGMSCASKRARRRPPT